MDKRTILFVIGLSLTLFLVNIFFQYQNMQKKQEWLSQQRLKEVLKEKNLQEDIAQRTAPAGALPLASLYDDAQSHTPLAIGVFNHNSILSLSWAAQQPATIFVKDPISNEM